MNVKIYKNKNGINEYTLNPNYFKNCFCVNFFSHPMDFRNYVLELTKKTGFKPYFKGKFIVSDERHNNIDIWSEYGTYNHINGIAEASRHFYFAKSNFLKKDE